MMQHRSFGGILLAAKSWSGRTAIVLLLTACIPFQNLFAQYQIADRGDFYLNIEPGQPGLEQQISSILRETPALHELIYDINGEINLTRNVTVSFKTWPAELSPNAIWAPGDSQITIGYSLISNFISVVGNEFHNWYPLVEQTVLHEIGHALIDVNDIPKYAGENEEAQADALAFFILSEFYDEESTLSSVAHYYQSRKRSGGTIQVSEHLLDGDRADMYLCWIEGKIQWLNEIGGQCRYHYENLVRHWEDRLGPSWNEDIWYD